MTASRRDAGTSPTSSTATRTAPIRTTVDYTPSEHERLKQWTFTASAQLGREVPLAELLRVLGRLVLLDRDLAARVRAQLEADGGKLTGELDKNLDRLHTDTGHQ